MSTVLSRPATRADRRAPAHRPTVPQVNLLPPEYSRRYALRRLQTRLALAVVLVAVLVVGGYAGSLLQLQAANDRRDAAAAETARLLTAQQQYAEVPQVLAELDRVADAREQGMSTEVLWTPYLRSLGGTMPGGVTLTSLTMTGATPMLAPAPATNPLDAPSVGTLTFEARGTSLVDTAAWADALNAIPGFLDARVSVTNMDESDGQTVYTFTSKVNIDERAYAQRFAAEEE